MSNPNLRAYAVGRYVDPHKRVMHEQHSVYRMEKLPEWNLLPQPDADPVLRAQKMRQERYADAATGQIEQFADGFTIPVALHHFLKLRLLLQRLSQRYRLVPG